MDEVRGRKVAMDMGLHIMGSIGVLLAAFKEGYLTGQETEVALEKIGSANRHISERLLKDALDIVDAYDRPEPDDRT